MTFRAPYAADPQAHGGREWGRETSGEQRGPRSAFQRDRDRIIHSMSFRRLKSKTQVFISPLGDHYRTRLTHSLEVAQIGRVIARALGLDEDLTEALCLAHDLGHPPFGHAGEAALSAAMARHGGFCHNAQALRTVMRIECPYPEHDGLNLTGWGARWPSTTGRTFSGCSKPTRSCGRGCWRPTAARCGAGSAGTYIAYDNHDIDDGLRAGLLELDDLLTLDFVADQWRAVEKRFPHAPRDRLLREMVRDQIGLMVNDVLEHTRDHLAGLRAVAEVREAGRQIAGFSPAMAAQERRLKAFMYERLYYHPEQVSAAERARDVVARLFAAYAQDARLMPEDWQARLPGQDPQRARVIADFIAGMSDHFAMQACCAIYGERPAGLVNV